MISHKYKCIFIHIPKCAGTSIENILGHHDECSGPGRQDHRTLRMYQPGMPICAFYGRENIDHFIKKIYRRLKHRTILNPKNKLTVSKKQYREYFKFTIIRNPWERVFSWYQNVMRKGKDQQEALNAISKTSFEHFLEQNIGKRHLMPQIDYIREYSGKINMDYIIKFEKLNDGFMKVSCILGLPTNRLPHEVKGLKLHYKDYYNSVTYEMVKHFYKEEIVLFEYLP